MRYLLNLSYDGSSFFGSQVQKDKITVCGSLEKVIKKITGYDVKLIACSRTDRGVHANDFYVHFDLENKIDLVKFKKSINSLTSEEIFIRKITKVSDEFNARFDVKNKEYMYVINVGEYKPVERNYILQYNKEINLKLIKKASKYLVGKHDFKSFTSDSSKKDYVRTINYIKFKKYKSYFIIYINADGFLKYMVRNIVGMFIDLNEGRIKLEDIKSIIESRERTSLGIKAPSNGLYLNQVNY